MEQTFLKTIRGRTIQFNRLLYPLQYVVKDNEPESDGTKFFFEKNGDGKWNTKNKTNLPDWLHDVHSDVCDIIEQNEISFAEAPCLKY